MANVLTTKQEKFCINLEVHRMSQYAAYKDAYDAENMLENTIRQKASLLAKQEKIRARCKELRDEIKEDMKRQATWTREDAHQHLLNLLEHCEAEIEKGKTSSAITNGISNAVRELNNIYGIADDTDNKDNTALTELTTAINNIGDER